MTVSHSKPTAPSEPRRAFKLAGVLLLVALVGVLAWRLDHLPSDQPHAERNPGFLVDVNQADTETLQLLPGLGPSIAANVVQYRETVGPFETTDQLEQVKMIDPVLRARIEPWVTLGQDDAADWPTTQPR
ncbi:MAG: helix-hairpin-helix domain-containing protein [Planctomycetota bacterium]